MASALYLADHRHMAPVYVIPCIALPGDRVDRQSALVQSALWGSIDQAGWSFMVAARARGLDTTWTCLHLFFEEEAAQLLGIPYAEVNQAALIPGSLYERHTVAGAQLGLPACSADTLQGVSQGIPETGGMALAISRAVERSAASISW
jgi:nitroreductase